MGVAVSEWMRDRCSCVRVDERCASCARVVEKCLTCGCVTVGEGCVYLASL